MPHVMSPLLSLPLCHLCKRRASTAALSWVLPAAHQARDYIAASRTRAFPQASITRHHHHTNLTPPGSLLLVALDAAASTLDPGRTPSRRSRKALPGWAVAAAPGGGWLPRAAPDAAAVDHSIAMGGGVSARHVACMDAVVTHRALGLGAPRPSPHGPPTPRARAQAQAPDALGALAWLSAAGPHYTACRDSPNTSPVEARELPSGKELL